MGRFDTQQAQVEALKTEEAPEELKKTIKDEMATLVFAVDGGEQILEEAAGQLQTPEAKKYIKEAGGEVKAILVQIASIGQGILKDKGKLEAGIGSIESLIDDLSKALDKEIDKIEEYHTYEERKKQTEAFASKVAESKKIHGELLNYEKEIDQIKEQGGDTSKIPQLETAILQHRDWLTADANGLAEMHKGIRTTEGGGQEGTILFSKHGDIFGHYKKIYTTKFQPAEKDYLAIKESLETIKLEQGGEVYDQLEAVKAALAEYETKFIGYEAKIQTYQRRTTWRKLPQEEKEAFLSMEGGLLGMYLSSKGMLNDIQSSPFVRRNSDTSVATESVTILKEVEAKIKNIETYKTFREVQGKKYGNSIKIEFDEEGYANIIIDGELVKKKARRIGEGFKPQTIIIDGKEVEMSAEEAAEREIMLALETRIEDARADVEEESAEMEKDIRERMGDRSLESLENQLGEKGKPYFGALKLMKAGDFKAAKKAFQEYISQEFSEEEKALHSEFIATAKEQIKVNEASDKYYVALKSLDSEPDIAYNLLNQYIESVGKLPEGEQALHIDQISNAKEVIKAIGLSQLQILDELLEDVSDVRGGKTGGNIVIGFTKSHRLSLSESTEHKVLSEGIGKLREQMTTKGNILDEDGQPVSIYKAIEELRAQAKAEREKVMKETGGYGEEDSMVDEIAELHEAINSKDPEKKKKAFVAFAKKAKGKMKLGIARKYLDKALEDLYEEYDEDGRSKYGESKREVKGDLLKDPQAVADVKSQAKQLYEKMKADNSLLGLSLEQIEKRLLDQRVDSVYRARIRRNMIVTDKLTESEEALDLYEDWFPHKESKWWNPFTWGAEETERNQIGMIRFALETAATMPLGYGAGRVGAKVGSLVVKMLGRGGMSAATCAAIEAGGLTALRAMLSKGGSRVLLGYAAAGIPSVSAEGAVFFAGGTFQSALFHYEETMEQIRSGGYLGSAKDLGVSIAKASAYRMIGRMGGRILGKNPGLVRMIIQEIAAGSAGMGVEAGFLSLEGQDRHITSQWAFEEIIGNAFQSGFAAAGRRAGRRHERKMERVDADIEEGAQTIREMSAEGGLDFADTIKAKAIAEDFRTKAEEARKAGDTEVAERYEEASRTIREGGKQGGFFGTLMARVGKPKAPEMEDPTKITAVKVTEEGVLLVNGKEIDGMTVEGYGSLPRAVQERLSKLYPDIGKIHKQTKEFEKARKRYEETRGNPIKEVQLDMEIENGAFPLLGEQIRTHLESPEGVTILKELLESPALKLDWKYTRAELEQKVIAAEQYFKDVGKLVDIGKVKSPKILGQKLRDVIADVKAGKPIKNDNIGKLFERMHQFAPEKIEALAKSDIEALLKTDCLAAILRNTTKELQDVFGGKITVYPGKIIKAGGGGQVSEVAFLSPDGESYTLGALKVPHVHEMESFAGEVAGARVLQQLNHPNLIRPLKIGKGFIIYETGSDARDLSHVLTRCNYQEALWILRETADGIIALHEAGYAHQDLKGGNVLSYWADTGKGNKRREIKVIDFAAIPLYEKYDGPLFQTTGYHLSVYQEEMGKDFVSSRGMTKREGRAWMRRAEDAKAYGRMHFNAFGREARFRYPPGIKGKAVKDMDVYLGYADFLIKQGGIPPDVPKSVTDPVVRNYLTLLKDSFDPTISGDPEFIKKFSDAGRALARSYES